MSNAETRELVLMPAPGPTALMDVLCGLWSEDVQRQGLGLHQVHGTPAG